MVKSCKTLNLVSGILEIIFSAFMIVMGLLFVSAALLFQSLFLGLEEVLPITGAVGAIVYSILGVVVLVIALVYGITYMIFGIQTIKCGKLEEEKYVGKRWLFLGFSIAETVLTGFIIYTLIAAFSVGSLVLTIVCVLILAMRYTVFGLLVGKAKTIATQANKEKELPAKPEVQVLVEPEQIIEGPKE